MEARVHQGGIVRGTLFVETASAVHSGPQTLLEYLQAPEPFVPFETEKEFLFLAKHSVISVTAREEHEIGVVPWDGIPLLPADDDEAVAEVSVRVEVRGGEIIEGELFSALPAEHRRVVDHLNQPSPFLLLRQGEYVHIINKTYIVTARPLPSP